MDTRVTERDKDLMLLLIGTADDERCEELTLRLHEVMAAAREEAPISHATSVMVATLFYLNTLSGTLSEMPDDVSADLYSGAAHVMIQSLAKVKEDCVA